MFSLPKSTAYNKKIPKHKFYEKMLVSPALKRIFVEQVKGIIWRNKIAPTSTNLAPGQAVIEIEFFEINLKSPLKDESLLHHIDKAIQAHIIYLLEYEGKYQAWVGVKELRSLDSKKSTIKSYFHTDWLTLEELPLKLDGLNVDAAYENFVRQIAGDRLSPATPEETLKDTVEREVQHQALLKKIATLEAKLHKEKQFNRQVEINNEIKNLRFVLSGVPYAAQEQTDSNN